jgi:hypothetical protein
MVEGVKASATAVNASRSFSFRIAKAGHQII